MKLLSESIECCETSTSNFTLKKMDGMNGRRRQSKDNPPSRATDHEEREAAQCYPQETCEVALCNMDVRSSESNIEIQLRDCGSDSFQKTSFVMMDKIINYFKYAGRSVASLFTMEKSEDEGMCEASRKDGRTIRASDEKRASHLNCNGLGDLGVVEIPVLGGQRTSEDAEGHVAKDEPRKLGTTPSSHVTRPSPLRAKRVCIRSDGEALSKSTERYEPVWLQRFVVELNSCDAEKLSTDYSLCIKCNRKHHYSHCDNSKGKQDDRSVPKPVPDNLQQMLSNDAREESNNLGDPCFQQAYNVARRSVQTASNIVFLHKGARLIRFKDEFDESMTSVICEAYRQHDAPTCGR